MTAETTNVIEWPSGEIKSLSEVLDQTVATIKRFVHFKDESQPIAVALWIAHTYAINECEHSARLAIRAPTKQSGKTVLLETLNELVKDGWLVIGPSAPVLFRNIEKKQPTVLLDEADRLFERRKEDTADVLQFLNTGHSKGASVPRMVTVGKQMDVHDFPTFAAVALAGIGTDWPDTIIDRAIVITLERKQKAEKTERLRRQAKAELNALATELKFAMEAIGAESLTVEQSELPERLSDRAQDGWEPLIAIADAAGADWPVLARNAAVELGTREVAGVEEREEILLLKDIRGLFYKKEDPDFLSSSELLLALLSIKESPWLDGGHRPLTTHKMGKLLRTFEIKSERNNQIRGYFLKDIVRHWDRVGEGRTLEEIVPVLTPREPDPDDPEAR